MQLVENAVMFFHYRPKAQKRTDLARNKHQSNLFSMKIVLNSKRMTDVVGKGSYHNQGCSIQSTNRLNPTHSQVGTHKAYQPNNTHICNGIRGDGDAHRNRKSDQPDDFEKPHSMAENSKLPRNCNVQRRSLCPSWPSSQSLASLPKYMDRFFR